MRIPAELELRTEERERERESDLHLLFQTVV